MCRLLFFNKLGKFSGIIYLNILSSSFYVSFSGLLIGGYVVVVNGFPFSLRFTNFS